MGKIRKKIFGFNLLIFSFFVFSNQVLAKFAEPSAAETKTAPSGTIDFEIIDRIVTFLFALVFIASLLGFAFSGIKFITAGGSEKALTVAHSTWISSLFGLLASLVGYVMLNIFKLIFIQ